MCWCCVHLALIKRTFREQTIVFIQTKKEAHRMHIVLGLLGVRVGELHGSLTQTQVRPVACSIIQTHTRRFKARFPLPEFTAWVLGPTWRPLNSGAFFDTRVDGLSWRVSKNAAELTARQLRCQKMHPSSWVVNSARWTRAVNSGSGNRALWPSFHVNLG